MNPEHLIRTLEVNGEVFKYQLTAAGEALARWRPDSSSWNLLEIVCHLCDEERDDFRKRTSLALKAGNGTFESISPVDWVQERNYADRDYLQQIAVFNKERLDSVRWLRSLINPNWEASFEHHQLGIMTAMRMLVNWVAHDFHHIRQINAIHYAWLKETSSEDLSYAGNWKP